MGTIRFGRSSGEYLLKSGVFAAGNPQRPAAADEHEPQMKIPQQDSRSIEKVRFSKVFFGSELEKGFLDDPEPKKLLSDKDISRS